jgi:hypothetical protein
VTARPEHWSQKKKMPSRCRMVRSGVAQLVQQGMTQAKNKGVDHGKEI